jgi:hypothetical protein
MKNDCPGAPTGGGAATAGAQGAAQGAGSGQQAGAGAGRLQQPCRLAQPAAAHRASAAAHVKTRFEAFMEILLATPGGRVPPTNSRGCELSVSTLIATGDAAQQNLS